jgi:hypothetical protein
MVWNSRLEPYKNAITNELWISASISMYRDFPGDNFTSPWAMDGGFPDKDPRHLAAAVEGYRWLQEVNMTNSLGLFVDGYHISSKTPGNVECDERDEMVYTYNQGVILSGQRSLWAVTGSPSYLDDGHRLIQSVISATGWSLRANSAVDKPEHFPQGQLPPWRGLGRGGILEEQCDASGTCSQDAQTFKGIFFHHFAAFCSTLDPLHDSDGDGDEPRPAGQGLDAAAHKGISQAHTRACNAYLAWVRHNYLAALRSRDERGRFGMWWGAGAAYGRGRDVLASPATDGIDHDAENTTDYRNEGTPLDAVWGSGDRWLPGRRRGQGEGAGGDGGIARQARQQVPKQTMAEHLLNPASRMRPGQFAVGAEDPSHRLHEANDKDPNSRGRGRTVETQMGGLALLRAYWEVSQSG